MKRKMQWRLNAACGRRNEIWKKQINGYVYFWVELGIRYIFEQFLDLAMHR